MSVSGGPFPAKHDNSLPPTPPPLENKQKQFRTNVALLGCRSVDLLGVPLVRNHSGPKTQIRTSDMSYYWYTMYENRGHNLYRV